MHDGNGEHHATCDKIFGIQFLKTVKWRINGSTALGAGQVSEANSDHRLLSEVIADLTRQIVLKWTVKERNTELR